MRDALSGTAPRRRESLLFISPRFLFPLDQGGRIRTANILRGLKGGRFELVLASPAPLDAGRFAAETATVCDRFLGWPQPAASRLRQLAALAGRLPVAVATDRSASGRRVIAAALRAGPDLVVVDFPHAAVLLPPALGCPSVIFTHNVEAEIFERHAAMARGMRRLLWRREAARMRDFEGAALRRFDAIVAVSRRDAAALRRRYGVAEPAVIDTGVDLDFYSFTPAPAPPAADCGTLAFVGAMDSRANIDGVEFLLEQVWPLLRQARPGIAALIIGRNPPPSLVARAERAGLAWRFTGFVEDVRPQLCAGHVAVIPLRVGSGTRIKAFEAMALGRPVVSTALGVEGLPVVPGEHYLAAETPAEFAAAVLRLLADPALAARLAGTARALLEARFAWSQVARQFEAICAATLARASQDGAPPQTPPGPGGPRPHDLRNGLQRLRLCWGAGAKPLAFRH